MRTVKCVRWKVGNLIGLIDRTADSEWESTGKCGKFEVLWVFCVKSGLEYEAKCNIGRIKIV